MTEKIFIPINNLSNKLKSLLNKAIAIRKLLGKVNLHPKVISYN